MPILLNKPRSEFQLPTSTDSFRRFGSCVSVEDTNGVLIGHVYKEWTIDANGRAVSVWWHAHPEGSRVPVLATSGTMKGAVALLPKRKS
jgi:hypothetical protein